MMNDPGNGTLPWRMTTATYSLPGRKTDPLVSQGTRQVIEAVCYAGLTAAQCLLGIPANVVNSLVFWRQGLKDRMNLCLAFLAVVDCAYLVITFLLFPVTSFLNMYDSAVSEKYYVMAFVYLGTFLYGLRSASGCTGVVIALERCVCVVFPLRASTLVRSRTMGMILVAMFLTVQGSHLVYLFMFHPVAQQTRDGVVWIFDGTPFYYANKQFVDIFAFTVLGTALPVISFVVVSSATGLSVVSLTAAIAWRKTTSSTTSDSHRRQVALTKMLVMVSCVYVITMVPFVARQIAFLFLVSCLSTGECVESYSALTAIVYTILHVNNSINIFIYYHRSSRFRLVVKKMMSRHSV